ncbi:MAG: glycosyltransferase family 4 protein [Nitrospira sp. CG24A]|nr:MAG: glycosyltransferase family 4 protein [Nitrospira sp. CG24A]
MAMRDTNVKRQTVGYLLKTYPKVSETFILQEILDLEALGLDLEIFSLQRPTDTIMPSQAKHVLAPVTYLPKSMGERQGCPLMSHLWLFATHPLRYVNALRFLRQRREGPSWSEFIQGGCLAWLLLQSGIRHLHAHFATEPAGTAELVHRFTGIPYSLTCHAKDIFLSSPEGLSRKMRHATFVVTCTEANRSYLQRIADNGIPIHRIYHGLNLARFDGLRKTDSSADTGILTILSVGRFREKKGFLTLIRACRILVDAGHRFRCQIVGYGPLQPEMEGLIRTLDLNKTLSLCGKKTLEEVVDLYRHAAIFALPCQVADDGDRDGIPNVFMEAMAMGLPVVSTDVSGIPELIHHNQNGLLVPQQDVESLAKALGRLLENPELRHRLGRAGRETIVKNFVSEQSSRQLKELFSETMHTRPTRVESRESLAAAPAWHEPGPAAATARGGQGTIGYILKGFPRNSEAFITNEIYLLERMGLKLRLFSAFQGDSTRTGSRVQALSSQLTYLPECDEAKDGGFTPWLLSNLPRYLPSHLHVLQTAPRRYLRTLFEALRLSVHCRAGVFRWPKKVFYKDFLRSGFIACQVNEAGDIRHLHAHFCHGSTTMAMFAGMLTGLPFSFTAHAKDIYLSKLNPGNLLQIKMRRARFVATCTGSNKQYLEEACPDGAPVHRIYHGVDTDRFRPSPDGAPDRPVILSVGRFVEKKGFPFLVEACGILRDHGHQFHCRIVGEPDEQTDLVRHMIFRASLEDRITIEPGVTQDELQALYQEATLFVLPCQIVGNGDRDGIPNVLAEAMATGLPVVTTDISGIPELVTHRENGLLVSQRDAHALAKAMEELLADVHLRQRLGQAGRDTICRIFNSATTTRQLCSLFDSLACDHAIAQKESHAACC